jgi:ABC-type multidrug transport system permease subunit
MSKAIKRQINFFNSFFRKIRRLDFIGLTFQPVFDDLWHGNVSVLIFAGFCLSYLLHKRGRNFSAGLALGLIIPLKFYPAIFVPYFIWRRNWRLVAGVAVSCLAIGVISLLTVGWEGNLAYFQMVRGELGVGGIAAFNDQSISGFLLHLFDYGDVNVWRNTPTPLWFAVLRRALVGVLFGTVIRVMRRRPENPQEPQ